ncbi:MAG: hypothetical protein BGP20_06125 [Thiobacillus sp. 63-78]|nr:DUF167 domain-containing protein [Thiobacillus sp.]MBN8765839.1 DUF167 domain-containing protein [Thiobacillus sp.]MBN8774856.1 DUF167 domain-containing protein [Thiobacillus sp.]ODV09637.1 MAG: hypothetical protein ABT22_12965 [Thiobacillus sp. SCN 64-317]OJZ15508.1 MAG: hypothetical protein BGP20_06125 [Thiobacillus sp. 63-78]
MVRSEQPPVWARRNGADWLLELHVQPGAKTTAVVGEHGGRLKLKIAAPAVDNKANAHLLAWLATQLGLPKSAVRLVRGESSRQKTVAVCGVDAPWREIGKNSQT